MGQMQRRGLSSINHEFGKVIPQTWESGLTGKRGENRERGQRLENGLERLFWGDYHSMEDGNGIIQSGKQETQEWKTWFQE